MTRKIYAILILILLTGIANAQIQTNWWFFGTAGGIQFTSGTPVPAPGGMTAVSEGTSAFSNETTGNLMFYSEGTTAWNASHVVMPNGFGLMGNSSSTMSCLIVPYPGSPNLFYIFTTDCIEHGGANGFRYSIVDMTLDGGMGDVVASSKNTLLFAPCSEQISAVKHANCTDWWVVAKESANNTYRAYLLTASGISAPVISSVGLTISSAPYGQAKFTPDGTHYAISANGMSQLFDFDNTTGVISNPVNLMTGAGAGEDTYGLAFSGDNTKLYVMRGSAASALWQYDISSGVGAAIIASGTLIANYAAYNQMQLGKDFKIYVARSGSPNWSVINNPNVAGVGCGFSVGTIPISGSSALGVCNYPDSYFNQVSPCDPTLAIYISHDDISCNGDTDGMAWVNISNTVGPVSISWSPGGSTNDTIFNLGPGTYYVTVTDSLGSKTDSVTLTDPTVLTVNATTSEDSVCAGTPVTLTATAAGGTTPYAYQWSTAANDTLASYSYTPSSSGYATVDITDAHGCTTTDSVYITVLSIPLVHSSNDTCICAGASVTITASGTPSYQWNTGPTTASITVSPTSTFTYIVSYSNGVCATSDSTVVCVNPVPSANITAPDSVCAGTSVTFTAVVSSGTTPFTYTWSGLIAGSTSSVTTTPAASGTETVNIVDDNGCSTSANTSVTVLPVPNITAPADTCICEGSSITLTAGGTPGYNWNSGQTTALITVSPTSTFTYIVSYSNGVCADDDSVTVCVNPTPVVIASNDTTVEYLHPATLLAVGTGPFDWSPSNSLSCTPCANPEANPEETTTYVVTTTNAFGCTASDEVTVTIYYVIIIPNIITPNHDGFNDNFRIIGLPAQSALTIFNRWGNLLFETGSYDNKWSIESDGVYYYVLKTPDGKNYNGFFHVTGN